MQKVMVVRHANRWWGVEKNIIRANEQSTHAHMRSSLQSAPPICLGSSAAWSEASVRRSSTRMRARPSACQPSAAASSAARRRSFTKPGKKRVPAFVKAKPAMGQRQRVVCACEHAYAGTCMTAALGHTDTQPWRWPQQTPLCGWCGMRTCYSL